MKYSISHDVIYTPVRAAATVITRLYVVHIPSAIVSTRAVDVIQQYMDSYPNKSVDLTRILAYIFHT
jgi:hypothetical protein